MTECDEVVELLRLDAAPNTREVITISEVLHEARALVRDAADEKAIRIIVVAVRQEVLVSRRLVVLVLASLLRNAIAAASFGGRVAVTGQEIERDLVFAVYDTGTRSHQLEPFAAESARALGGRVWTAHPPEGHLALFSVSLVRDVN